MSFLTRFMTGPLFVIVATAATATFAQDHGSSVVGDLAAELPRIAPKSPAESIATFMVADGLRVELVASEPLVVDPIALAFDERGRLFALEMRSFNEIPERDLGRVRLLVDGDGDGVFDRSTVYADGFTSPTGLGCYDGGVFVAATTNVWYVRDTNEDGVADERRVVFTGLAEGVVPERRVNSFRWGLDNRMHVAGGRHGGSLRSTRHPERPAVNINGRDFAFDPRTEVVEATSGGSQHGLSFDRWGNKFLCANSHQIQQVMFEDRYVARNPYMAAADALFDIPAEGAKADVFRASTVEPSRVVRTRLRAAGLVHGGLERGGEVSGYFTSASGVMVYTGDALPAAFQGNAFVGEVSGNLVHRMLLAEDGLAMIARRAEEDERREFLTATDNWFRPVSFANAPDGALYIADMYRELVEAIHTIPRDVAKHLGASAGADLGRIYRVVPEGFVQPKLVRLDEATTAELVACLEDTNGWRREMAARLLFERQDATCEGALRRMANDSTRADARLRALWTLHSLGMLDGDTVVARLSDDDAHVREHAVRLSEGFVQDERITSRWKSLVHDPSERVRYQMAFSLGEWEGDDRLDLLMQLIASDSDDPWMRVAVQSSLAKGAGQILARLLDDEASRGRSGPRTLIDDLAAQIGRQRRDIDVAAAAKAILRLSTVDEAAAGSVAQSMVRAAVPRARELRERLAEETRGASERWIADALAEAARVAVDDSASVGRRVRAIASLEAMPLAESRGLLAGLLAPRQPAEAQIAALSVIGSQDDDAAARLILEAWNGFGPAVRGEALNTLFSRNAWIVETVEAVDRGSLSARDLGPLRLDKLAASTNATIRARAERWRDELSLGMRDEVVERYRPALELAGDQARGREVFRKECATCHRVEGFGNNVGPELIAMRYRGPEAILLNVLDPNRQIDPAFIGYLAQTVDGRAYTGLIASENSTSITLKRAEGLTDTILRLDIDVLTSTEKSIMPEGLEQRIDIEAMADLLTYLTTIQ